MTTNFISQYSLISFWVMVKHHFIFVMSCCCEYFTDDALKLKLNLRAKRLFISIYANVIVIITRI